MSKVLPKIHNLPIEHGVSDYLAVVIQRLNVCGYIPDGFWDNNYFPLHTPGVMIAEGISRLVPPYPQSAGKKMSLIDTSSVEKRGPTTEVEL